MLSYRRLCLSRYLIRDQFIEWNPGRGYPTKPYPEVVWTVVNFQMIYYLHM